MKTRNIYIGSCNNFGIFRYNNVYEINFVTFFVGVLVENHFFKACGKQNVHEYVLRTYSIYHVKPFACFIK